MLRFFPLLLLVLLSGCIKNEMTLTFRLPPDVNEPCRIIYYVSGKKVGMMRETVVEIREGKGEVRLPMQYPSVIYLFAPSRKMPDAILYGQRGDKIIVDGKSGDIIEWKISGNKASEDLTAWRIKNIDLLRHNDPSSINKAVAQFIEENPDSPAAAIILYVYFQRKGHEKEFYELESSLSKKLIKDSDLMQALAQGDLITSLPETPIVPKRIILRGEDGYLDTLNISKGDISLIIFHNSKDPSFSVSSIKSLLEESEKAKIVELYLDTDSMSWKRHLKKDTIERIQRLWMPLGLTDSVAISMGVRRVPYYIVVDSKSKIAYSGDDFHEASKKFKSLAP